MGSDSFRGIAHTHTVIRKIMAVFRLGIRGLSGIPRVHLSSEYSMAPTALESTEVGTARRHSRNDTTGAQHRN